MHYTIPDGFTVFGFVWALVASLVSPLFGETLPFTGMYDAVVGACAGAGAIAIIGWLGEVVLRREAMGFGDVTLMAMIGAHLGPERALLTIFAGAALGAVLFAPLAVVIRARRERSPAKGVDVSRVASDVTLAEKSDATLPLVPFGVFLAPGALIALLWGRDLIDWYLKGVLGL